MIGIDEIALKKGHQDFATIITGRIEGKAVILGVLGDRKKGSLVFQGGSFAFRGVVKYNIIS